MGAAVAIGILSALTGLLPPASDVGARVVEDVVEVRLGGEPFTRIHWAAEPMPYLYPVFAAGGVPMTRGWPLEERPDEERDHPHHRSFWIAHGDVDGHDFWHDPNARIVADGPPRVTLVDGEVVVSGAYDWRVGEDVILREVRTLAFAGSGEGDRRVDVTSAWTAATRAIVIGDTKEGTFALRLHPNLRLRGRVAAGAVSNREGVTGSEVWGKRSAWVAYQGPVDGESVGVAIFDHPSNPRHPTWWHARDYGLFAANPFGAHDFEGAPEGAGDLALARGATIELRYRVLVFRGARGHDELESVFAEFSGAP